jgi:hypothetical protein
MKRVLTILCVALATASTAQIDSLAVKYGSTITAEDLKKHLYILAADEYEGRETGLPGQKKAAEYISNYFKDLGIAPCVDGSYYQEFPLKEESSLESDATVGGKDWKFIDDFFFFPGFEGMEYKPENLLFLGYGIHTDDYSDYSGLSDEDLKGKMIMIFDGEPYDKNGNSLVTKSEKSSEWASDWRMKRDEAQTRGVSGIVVIKPGYKKYVGRVKYWLQSPGMRLDYGAKRGEVIIPTFFVSPDMADVMVSGAKVKNLESVKKKISKKGKTISADVPTDLVINVKRDETRYTGENVLAYLKGSDPDLQDELVIVTAHYDHVGITNDEVYNGADDDGSGTVTALEIAQAFKMAVDEGNGPRRSVLIMTVSGEEKGLLGSEWYSEFPIFPLENTVCDLNIDMIGRVDDKHMPDSNYVYLIGSDKLSTDLHKVSEAMNSSYTKLDLDYTYNDPDDPNRFYYRSDHYNFAKNGIPVIFYFSGVHEDYHQPGDDPEKILYEKTAAIGRLIFHTAWEIANMDKRLEVDVENDFEN